jgi:hypothetical protein
MENDPAKFMDVIESSLQMVGDGSAYIGVISKKSGQMRKLPRGDAVFSISQEDRLFHGITHTSYMPLLSNQVAMEIVVKICRIDLTFRCFSF